MRFPIAREIWKHSHGLNRLKLLAAASTATRPWLKPLAMAYLKNISEDGIFWAEYESAGHMARASFRLSELSSDIYILKEVGVGNCYHIPDGYEPDLIIDAGGNNGMFSLSALKRWPNAKLKIFEPVPDNLERIRAHLKANGMSAEIYSHCLGLANGMRTFYGREPEQGSFFTDPPYTHMMDVQVVRLSDYLENDPHARTFIKLDIEGAELEVLEDILQKPRPNTFIVGELHHHKGVKDHFLSLIEKAHLVPKFFDASELCVIFHAIPKNGIE